jgi:integrase/recombinase XerD
VFVFTSRQGSRLSRRQVYNLFRKYAELAGINEQRAHPHILKHSYGTHLHKNGASPFYIMKALGHKDVRTSLRYTHVSTADAQEVSDRISREGLRRRIISDPHILNYWRQQHALALR